MVRSRFVVLLFVPCVLCADFEGAEIKFLSPSPDQAVSGRSFLIDIEVTGVSVPSDAKGVLLLDEGRLLEVRQQRITITMDGAGGLSEGAHILRLQLVRHDGTPLISDSVTFIKEGFPEELAGPFHDSRYDDEALHEVSRRTSLPPPSPH